MDAAETLDAVREEARTDLERLGSDKLLVAVTGADLTPVAVREAAATREHGVADAMAGWADDADGAVATAFTTAEEGARDCADRIDADPGDPDALATHLQTVGATDARVGAGLVAVPLLADRFYLQVVSFFVNEADEAGADTFRDLRADASDLDVARDALSALDDAGREAARDAAVETIEAAYADYADTLAGMGLDPKPIC
ncbi:transcription antitermination protein [Halomicroarcula sp. F13]|uniref:Transcription antitermination protein n=1 Tax=Haloarcula rubra TaxID=2487747 RepID=A0AAW4PN28_9EURY|nr:transcription antitermination protein [Halomicroarcula rubra]MBX0322156.1 transcription antitermination protein [Halomicroarcula rubra]